MRQILYLAGPIFGKSDSECRDWRARCPDLMLGYGFYDPMRRDYRGRELDNVDAIIKGDLEDIVLSTGVLVYAETPSWGTAMEIVYARMLGRPIVVVCSGRVSPWLAYHASVVVPTLEAAAHWIKKNLPIT